MTEYRVDHDSFMKPIWKGDIVYDEQILFTPDLSTGKLLPCQLLYPPVEILSVPGRSVRFEENGTETYRRYPSITVNFVNHPNDFLIRI